MSAEKKDGGLAFPSRRYEPASIEDPFEEPVRVEYPGLTIRDWFAGQAMASLIIVNAGCFSSLGVGAAKDAYAAADAMLKARDAPLN